MPGSSTSDRHSLGKTLTDRAEEGRTGAELMPFSSGVKGRAERREEESCHGQNWFRNRSKREGSQAPPLCSLHSR